MQTKSKLGISKSVDLIISLMRTPDTMVISGFIKAVLHIKCKDEIETFFWQLRDSIAAAINQLKLAKNKLQTAGLFQRLVEST